MNKIKQSILSVVIGLALAGGVSFAWNGPGSNPPNGNAPAPINVGSISQDFAKGKQLQVKGGVGVLDLFSGLKVNGVVQIKDGTEGAGKVLTSDTNGIASWATPTPSGGSGNDPIQTGMYGWCYQKLLRNTANACDSRNPATCSSINTCKCPKGYEKLETGNENFVGGKTYYACYLL